MTGEKATIFDIARLSFTDGPGIRTAVFFKGCNLHCAWCHNPESQREERELLYYRDRCTGCGRCRTVCPRGAEDCARCGACAEVCPSEARVLCGREMGVEELFSEIERDRTFYAASGGGVTFSGGECMLKVGFLTKILNKCKENLIHTAVDTAGCVPFSSFLQVLPHTDLFLYDIKLADPEKHRRYTGVDNRPILENYARLHAQGARILCRIPVIAGVNDTEEEMRAIRAFLDAQGYPEAVELLPYHAMGCRKSEALGRVPARFAPPTPERMEELRAIFA